MPIFSLVPCVYQHFKKISRLLQFTSVEIINNGFMTLFTSPMSCLYDEKLRTLILATSDFLERFEVFTAMLQP